MHIHLRKASHIDTCNIHLISSLIIQLLRVSIISDKIIEERINTLVKKAKKNFFSFALSEV